MRPQEDPHGAHYERLRSEAWELTLRGEFRRSLALFDEALGWARQSGDPEMVDRAICNRASILVELGETAAVKQDLRRILLRSRDPESSFLAAYSLSRTYDVEGDPDKALFYARIAQTNAEKTDSDQQLASSYNLLGNLLVAQSDFEGALRHFETALSLLPPGLTFRRGAVLDSAGYCHTIRGRYRKAFRCLFESLRISRRLGARSFEASARLSLAFAYLQVQRYDRSIRHARISLGLAEATGDRMNLKHSLFVLGEAEKMAGNPLAARGHFQRLQQDFYPGGPNVADLLLVLNVKNLVNIKA